MSKNVQWLGENPVEMEPVAPHIWDVNVPGKRK
jgi:hypothetical protein